MRERNRAIKKVIPIPISTEKDDDAAPEVQQISDDSSVDSLLYSHDSNLREVFGATTMLMMPLWLLREVTKMLFHQKTMTLGHPFLVCPLVKEMREQIYLLTLS
jgi:hypothetical protein